MANIYSECTGPKLATAWDIGGNAALTSKYLEIAHYTQASVWIVSAGGAGEDRAGSLYIETSKNGVNWITVATVAVVALTALNHQEDIPGLGGTFLRVRWERTGGTVGTADVLAERK